MSLYYTLKEKLFPAKDGNPQFTPQFRLTSQLRNVNQTDALAMRTADPLWMLGRQWQFGEFVGEDNGSPIQVKTTCHKASTEYLTAGKNPSPRIPINNRPPEFLVEAMESQPTDLRSRVRIGQHFEQLIKDNFSKEKANDFIEKLRKEYSLNYSQPMDAKSKRFLKLMQGKVIDGSNLIEAIENDSFSNNNFTELEFLEKELKKWYDTLFSSPTNHKSWNSEQLSHQFKLHQKATKTSNDISLNAPDYQSGHFDWYAFDSANIPNSVSRKKEVVEQLTPVNASFSFMPEKRLFAFEDNRIDLLTMNVGTDDLMKLMLLDFSLVSGSDWFSVPIDMKLGELCWVENIEVKDVFGISTIIENDEDTGAVLHENPLHTWDLFKIRNNKPESYRSLNHFLYLSPTAFLRMESLPVEELHFYRDEFANMVWAEERTVQNAMGTPRMGSELHLELSGKFSKNKKTNNEIPRFNLASNVPTHWIPYLPFQASNNAFNIILHQAKTLRNEHNNTPTEIEPLTFLASQDIKTIREEAIPQEGLKVQITNQRIRWADGGTYVWKGRKIVHGNGEGNSGLQFDYLD